MIYLGIDLGGTHIAAGIVSEEGKVLLKDETPTLVGRPWQEIVRDMATLCLRLLEEGGYSLDDVHSVGMGVPGVAIPETGVIPFCTNLGWHDIPMRDEFQKYLDKPLFIENDATVAGFAESVSGVSAGVKDSVFLTLGTGVGGGIVLGGKVYSGAHHVGSELGHMTFAADGLMCTCGKRGCWERYASATALIRMGREAFTEHPESLIGTLCDQDPDKITAKTVIDAAKQQDRIASAVFEKYIFYLTVGINTIVSFLDPEMIVLGGGVSKAGNFLLNAVRDSLPKYLFYKTLPYARVELAQLGNDAGIIGAAMLGRQ